jgi:hypothetical protein
MIPRLEILQDEHPDWKDRVEIIAVSIDDKREDAAQCCTKNQWTKINAAWGVRPSARRFTSLACRQLSPPPCWPLRSETLSGSAIHGS